MADQEQRNASGHRVGIDLGTTNSLVAIVRPDGAVEVLPSREQEAITPSVVSQAPKPKEGDNYLIGRQAANNAKRAPENTIRSIKRFIGLPFNDPKVQVAKQRVAYAIQAVPGSTGVAAKLGDKLLTPEEVSALILRKLKEDAERRLGGEVTQAVITVPAYFEEHRRVATRRAGALAGLNVLAILDEPTAAAISESEGEQSDGRVLVFDFGGGTLDISLIIRSKRQLHVKSYTGDAFLGGDDIDRGIAELLKARIHEQGGQLPAEDRKLDALLKEAAEVAKKTLAAGQEATVLQPGVCRNADGELLDLDTEISQDDFMRVLEPLLDRVRKLMNKFMHDESLEPHHILEVLMVGGSSAVAPFQSLLQELYEGDGQTRVKLARSPMEAVAKGAARYASLLSGLICPSCRAENTLDATKCSQCQQELAMARVEMRSGSGGIDSITAPLPRSLGVTYRQGDNADAYQVILKKGSLYPTPKPVAETFQLPTTDRFQIQIREGDAEFASRNALVGLLTVEELPPDVQQGDPVVVAFGYTRDRTLHITLSYPSSKTQFKGRYKLTPPDGKSDALDDPIRLLSEFIPRFRSFINDYSEFMQSGQRKVMTEQLEKAQQAVLDDEKDDAMRLGGVLMASMRQGCGLASTLFMAENTIANEDAVLGKVIRESAQKLRQQHRENHPDKERTRQALDNAIGKALSNLDSGVRAEILGGDTIYRGG